LWFFLLPLGQRDLFRDKGFWLGVVYVCFPLGLLLYGVNDLFDAQTDNKNPRKDSWLFGARLGAAKLRELPRYIVAGQLPFVVVFSAWFGPILLLWFLGAMALSALYNAPRWGAKNWPGLDLLSQACYLMVFVLSTLVCRVPQLDAPALAFSALFAMLSHLFGQLMDVEEDRAAGRHSTVVVLGVRAGKALLVALLVAETWLSLEAFRYPAIAGFMAAGAAVFLVDVCWGYRARPYPTVFSKVFFVGWNLVVLVTMYPVWKFGVFVAH
jgi:4-hydroxybenzoate polyprenyltransferase